MAIVLTSNREINPKPRIVKSDKQIFTNRFQLLAYSIILVFIWAIGTIQVMF